ncbi:YkvA family protein [Microbacterium stercoris]|uniref:DUF1232 domain-containing protein n=1 Tax=Microbacterium stercoris TaxID=2820289 RepID=A0A939TTI9_9MICO|nr:YkvA family protein [Microbacterium stercoris]MBO3663029.1 DUF1232 domain-containing protein [Microbacterium stercoris]
MNTRRIIGSVLVGAAAIVYGASPIDIIPELLGPIGLADDAVVIAGAGLAIWRMLGRRKPKA